MFIFRAFISIYFLLILADTKGDYMEFIKTEKGWLNLETEQLTLFGDLAAALWGTLRETFEYINKKIDQYYNFSSDCSLVRIIGRNDF